MDDHATSLLRMRMRREAARSSGKPIPTNSSEQASVILETFFATARKHVRVLTGGLNARIYGEEGVIIEARKFLADTDHRLDIIMTKRQESQIWNTHPLLKGINDYRNVHLYNLDPERPMKLSFHFTVADGHAYRFKRTPNGHASIVSFGDETFGKDLVALFETLKSFSIELSKPSIA